MKIAFFSTYLFGGAGSSARSIVNTMIKMGHDVKLYYRFGTNAQKNEICLDHWYSNDQINKAIKLGNKNLFYRNDNETCVNWEQIEQAIFDKPDIIVLFWYSQMLTPIHILKMFLTYDCPIVIFMSDNQAISGGCHFSSGCDRFNRSCGCCPQLESAFPLDHSHRQLKEKIEVFSRIPIHLIAPSSWQIELAKNSSVPFATYHTQLLGFPIYEDYLEIELEKYKSFSPVRFIWTASFLTELRKGFPLFFDVLSYLDSNFPEIRDLCEFTILGKSAPTLLFDSLKLNIRTVDLLPSAEFEKELHRAHVVINTTFEDAGPGTLMIAMFHGCIPISFSTGVASDLIDEKNGLIVETFDYKKVAHAIVEILKKSSQELIDISKLNRKYAYERMDEKKTFQSFFNILTEIKEHHKLNNFNT